MGIPDFAFIIFSYSFMSMLGELISMPLLSLAAVLSPKNYEGTSYSVFMSAINFGGILSSLLGSMLTNMLKITKSDYRNLPDLIIIANFVSLLPLPFLFCLNKSYFDPQVKHAEDKIGSDLIEPNHVCLQNSGEYERDDKREITVNVIDGTRSIEIKN